MTVDIIAVAVLGLLTGMLCVILKQHRPEFAMAAGICFSAVLLIYLLGRMTEVFALLDGLARASGISTQFFSSVIRGLGIGIIVGFASDSCADAGQTSLASKIEFAGKLAILYLCIPMIEEIIGIIKSLLG